MKYSLVPRDPQLLPPLNPQDKTDDYLGRTLAQYLKSHAAIFDFRIQVQTDPVTMPIEDATILWDEKLSPPLTLATLTLPMQDVDSPAGREWSRRGEVMAFSPWNALAEHRPMGGINRLRQSVYLASQARRGASGSSASQSH